MSMTITYKLLISLIKARRTKGLEEKADVFFAAGRITEEEYRKIIEMLKGPEEDD